MKELFDLINGADDAENLKSVENEINAMVLEDEETWRPLLRMYLTAKERELTERQPLLAFTEIKLGTYFVDAKSLYAIQKFQFNELPDGDLSRKPSRNHSTRFVEKRPLRIMRVSRRRRRRNRRDMVCQDQT